MGKYDPPENVYEDLACELKSMLETGIYEGMLLTEVSIMPMLERHFYGNFSDEASRVFEEFIKIRNTKGVQMVDGKITGVNL